LDFLPLFPDGKALGGQGGDVGSDEANGKFEGIKILDAESGFGEGDSGSGPDQIGDFVVGQDKFILQFNSFPGVSAVEGTNRLSSRSFLVLESGAYTSSFGPAGAAASDAFLFYENVTGRLGFDPDGTAGANPGVTLAILNGRPGVTASDITLI
jgi:hypothetical protein